ncbi:MAG TPA: isoprenylcysteine carboxylmethyltransferase family protein [Candidatus Paceibacterota bacterium]|nr:hypothetical protein [Verrucomicrobiota bacterium]HOX01701.1 isoprenylcysteine carboxylmethyltransferase family protein [Verrucomicrobiota bacterium]HRZ44150.1 isoprenylcysteine carboxylmethyltransferase family protein [Candidatus Paceibacterota bacterium]HRZ91310.1 isoprenylcysteine carboxylmethyltransferase family protein [Candidatus Paceibacterota bacterium]
MNGETVNHRHNVSYLAPDLPPVTTRQIGKHCLASALIYGVLLVFITFNPYFRDLLSVPFRGVPARQLYLYGYLLYLAVTPVILLVSRPRSLWLSKNVLIAGYARRLLTSLLSGSGSAPAGSRWPAYAEKHAMMFLLIKVFYGPLMIHSALIEYNALPSLIHQLRASGSWLGICDRGYLLLVSGVFFLDSLLFIVGYHTESGFLKNRLRYAETNVWHILVCIACYPPFNMVTCALLGPSNHHVAIQFAGQFPGDLTNPITWILRGAAVLFLLLLLSASAALFTKASNLTNRGIVQSGPYRYIRHPGYLAKNMFWLMTLIPVLVPNTSHPNYTWMNHLIFCGVTLWGLLGWGAIYYLRSLTEETFLSKDPDYVAYCQKVRYRFIPGVL